MRHPNVVRLYDMFADGARWLFTMELIRGQPFDRWVRPRHGRPGNGRAVAPLDEALLRAALPGCASGPPPIRVPALSSSRTLRGARTH